MGKGTRCGGGVQVRAVLLGLAVVGLGSEAVEVASVNVEDAGVQHRTLLECRTDGTVQAVFQVKVAVPLDDVGEQVAKERRVLGQQRVQVEVALGGDQLGEPDLARRQTGPLGQRKAMVGIWTAGTYRLENHPPETSAGAMRWPAVYPPGSSSRSISGASTAIPAEVDSRVNGTSRRSRRSS